MINNEQTSPIIQDKENMNIQKLITNMRNFMNALETEILGLVQKKSDSLKKVIINSSLFKLLNSYNSKMKPLNQQLSTSAKPFYQQNENQESNSKYEFKEIESGETDFSILTYNILADSCADHKYFNYIQPKYLNFNYRSQNIMKQIEQLNADILCLQEVDRYEDFYKNALQKLNYESIFHEKFNKNYGDLLAWKPSKFLKIKQTQIVYQHDLPLHLINVNEYKSGAKAMVVEFQHKKTNQKLVVANTHLYWNPYFENVKLFEASRLIKLLSDMYNHTDNVIVCGDMNSQPDSNVLKLFLQTDFELQKNQFINQNKINLMNEHLSNLNIDRIIFHSSYQNYRKQKKHPKFTNFTDKFKGTIDYIFYNQQAKLRVKKILELPDEVEIEQYFLPNQQHSSDHIPLMAYFQIVTN